MLKRILIVLVSVMVVVFGLSALLGRGSDQGNADNPDDNTEENATEEEDGPAWWQRLLGMGSEEDSGESENVTADGEVKEDDGQGTEIAPAGGAASDEAAAETETEPEAANDAEEKEEEARQEEARPDREAINDEENVMW